MLHFSEYVSIGHPDKIADYISEYLLDRYIERDIHTKYAVEVQIKDTFVTLGGEVSSKVNFSDDIIESFVRKAVNEIGYTKEYQDKWGKENTICGDDLIVINHIGQQSPEIAQGVWKYKGWGDQGIFYGYAEPNPEYDYMPIDHSIAKRICKGLFESNIGGLDIKTQVIMDNADIKEIIAAIPLLDEAKVLEANKFIRNIVPGNYSIIINGTGSYRQHSSIADCGTTGRKLAVDFYGGNCKIGGGSPWTKDGSKADLSLNLLARKIAKGICKETGKKVETSIACCIGKPEIIVSSKLLDHNGTIFSEEKIDYSPKKLIMDFNLDQPIYTSMCRWGLFGEFQKDKKWEK